MLSQLTDASRNRELINEQVIVDRVRSKMTYTNMTPEQRDQRASDKGFTIKFNPVKRQ